MIFPIGREKEINLFSGLINGGRLGHAYLFDAPQGMGKKTLCLYIVHLIMCTEHSACMHCNGCLTVSSGANPDVITVNNGDKASIGVDKIRDMIRDVYIRPITAEKKVFVIENAHLLTPGAQNALLKVIEEPPQYAVFFLLCDSTNPILQTIMSRVCLIRPAPLGTELLQKIVPGCPMFLYHCCEGNVGRLIRLRDDEDFASERGAAIDGVMSFISDDDYSMYEKCAVLESDRKKADAVTELMLMFVRDVILWKNGLEDIIINKDKINEIKAFSESATAKQCFAAAECIRTSRAQLGKSGNLAMAAQTLFMKCREVMHD